MICHQDQASRIQAQFNEEELKNSKLLQEIAKLEEQVAVITRESDCKDEVEIFNLHEKLENVLFLKKKKKSCPDFLIIYTVVQQLSAERNNWNKDQLGLQETINNLQQSLQSEQQAAEG